MNPVAAQRGHSFVNDRTVRLFVLLVPVLVMLHFPGSIGFTPSTFSSADFLIKPAAYS